MAGRDPFDEEQPSKPVPQVDPAVVAAVANAYYSRFMSSGETARGRAQAAYAISSAAAGAVIIGLATGRLGERGVGSYVGTGALVGWLLAAALYLRAVAAPGPKVDPAEFDSPSAFVGAVAADARTERDTVDKRQCHANVAALIAALLTVLAILAPTFWPGASTDAARGVVVLGKEALASVRAVCPGVNGSLTGMINLSTLDTPFLKIVPTGEQCAAGTASIRIPENLVLAVRLDE